MKIPKFNANQILSKVQQIGDRLSGSTARRYEHTAHTLRSANSMGLHGANKVPQGAIGRMERLAKVERGRSTQTRIKAAVGVSTVGVGGFVGLHKYHQHKDEKIMARINSMYGSPD